MVMECPACHTELLPGNTQCPTCLRPISRHELMRSLREGRRQAQWERRRPMYVAGAIGLILAGGYGLMKWGTFGAPAPKRPPPVPIAVPKANQVNAPLTSPGSRIDAPPPAQPAPVPGPSQKPASPPEPEEPPAPEEWTVSGTVYDLLTLKPAAAARLSFENRSSGEVFKAKTDSHGRYAVHLPKLSDGGYWVGVRAKGYRGDYLEEGSPPFTSRGRPGREEAAAEAAQTQVLHVPIFLDKENELEYNLALLPHE